MKTTHKGVLGAMVYTIILVLVMFCFNYYSPDENFSARVSIAIPAAFIAYLSGFRSGAMNKKTSES